MFDGIIYKYTSPSGKVYIGLTMKYRDEFAEIPKKIQIRNKKSSKLPVIEYTLDGKETRRWPNMTIAALDLGYSLGNFSIYCNGKNNHEYKGFLYYRGEKDS